MPPTKKERAPKSNMAQNYRKGTVRVQLHTAAGVPLKNWLEVERLTVKNFLCQLMWGREARLSIPYLVNVWPI